MRSRPVRERGQGLVEYGLILILIAVVVIAAVRMLGPRVRQLYYRVAFELRNPGQYSGPPVTAQSVGVNANASCLGGTCSGVNADATVSLADDEGNPVSAPVQVQFINHGDGTQKIVSGTGTVNSGALGGGSSGDTVEACIIAVEGYSILGNPCSSGSYD